MRQYPIMLNLERLSVVVVGAGRVGRRRAELLAAAGARVLVVDPAAEEAPEGAQLVAEPYRPAHLAGRDVVVASTGEAALNARIAADARALGALVNLADDPAASDFVFPAAHAADGVTVAVATGEPAPTAAVALLGALVEALGPRAGDFARAVAELRQRLQVSQTDDRRRRELLRRLAAPEALTAFRAGGREALERLLHLPPP